VGLASSNFPQGDGWATLTVQRNGSVSVKGRLGDGQTFTYTSYLSKDNILPLYLTPYSGTGTVTGSLNFRDIAAQSDVDGIGLRWFKPANSKDTAYRLGWPSGIQVDFIGSKFVPQTIAGKTPIGNDPVIAPIVNGMTTLSDAVLTTSLCNNLSIGTSSRVTVAGAPTGSTAASSLALSITSSGTTSAYQSGATTIFTDTPPTTIASN
jgi:hypothetical protein